MSATAAEFIASDATWGNTEGPAFDSNGALYFCARGSFKGIIRWTDQNGGEPFVELDAINGPGGLWIDDEDNIYATGPGERRIYRVSPDRQVTVLAEGFEADPSQSRGPNDLVMAPDKSIYFTNPRGFYGDAPAGTIYRLTPSGEVRVFDDTVVGPNGIALSRDGKTIFVAGNVGETTAKLTRFELNADGSAGAKVETATIDDCVADGLDIDREGGVWVTCYSFGTAYRIGPTGTILEKVTVGREALTNCRFGRGPDSSHLYLTSSDMERATGYIYRAKVTVPGFR